MPSGSCDVGSLLNPNPMVGWIGGLLSRPSGAKTFPQTLPGSILVNLDAATPDRMFTTAGGSTPSTDGTSVAGWQSLSGASLGRLNTTDSGSGAFTARAEGGILVAEALGGAVALGVPYVKTWTAHTVYLLARLTTIVGGNSFLTMGAAQAVPWYGARNALAAQMRAQPWVTAQTTGTSAIMTTKWFMLAFTYDGSGNLVRAYQDGANRTATLAGVAGPSSVDGVLISLGRGAASNFCNMRIAGLLVYEGAAHTAAQVRSLMDYWTDRYPTLIDLSDPFVLFTGSSFMMDASVGTDGTGLAAVTLATSTKFTSSSNCAFSGSTTPQNQARLDDDGGWLIRRRTGEVVVAHHCGGNDISAGGMTAQQVYDNLCSFHDAVQNIREDTPVCISTYLPQTGVNNTTRNAANVIITADAQGLFPSRIAPFASDPEMGGDGQNVPPLYQADGTHLTVEGSAQIAGYEQPVVDAQFT